MLSARRSVMGCRLRGSGDTAPDGRRRDCGGRGRGRIEAFVVGFDARAEAICVSASSPRRSRLGSVSGGVRGATCSWDQRPLFEPLARSSPRLEAPGALVVGWRRSRAGPGAPGAAPLGSRSAGCRRSLPPLRTIARVAAPPRSTLKLVSALLRRRNSVTRYIRATASDRTGRRSRTGRPFQ